MRRQPLVDDPRPRQPTISFSELVREMVEADYTSAKRDSPVKSWQVSRRAIAMSSAPDKPGQSSVMHPIVESKRQEVAAVCRSFGVRRLEVFGSAARADFDQSRSDIDLLVEPAARPDTRGPGPFFGLEDALERLFARHVDLVQASAVRNHYVHADIDRHRRLLNAT